MEALADIASEVAKISLDTARDERSRERKDVQVEGLGCIRSLAGEEDSLVEDSRRHNYEDGNPSANSFAGAAFHRCAGRQDDENKQTLDTYACCGYCGC